ncbi:hypothetical protein DLAC_10194, partial [Tieghemostelium lacteum]
MRREIKYLIFFFLILKFHSSFATDATTSFTPNPKGGWLPFREPTYFIDHLKNETDFNLDQMNEGGAGLRGFTAPELTADNCYLPKLNMTTPIMNPNSNASQEVWIQSSESYSNRFNKSFGKYISNEVHMGSYFSRYESDGSFNFDASPDFGVKAIDNYGYGKEGEFSNYNWCMVMRLWYCANTTVRNGISFIGTNYEMSAFMDNQLVMDTISRNNNQINANFNISTDPSSNPHRLDIFICQKGVISFVPGVGKEHFSLKIFGLNNNICAYPDDDIIKNCVPSKTTTTATNTPPVDDTTPQVAAQTSPVNDTAQTSPVTATTTDTITPPVASQTSPVNDTAQRSPVDPNISPVDPKISPIDATTSPITATATSTSTTSFTPNPKGGWLPFREPTYFIDHFKNETDFNLDQKNEGGAGLRGFTAPELTADNCYLPKLNMTTPIMNPNSNASQEVWVQSSESYSNRFNKSFGKYISNEVHMGSHFSRYESDGSFNFVALPEYGVKTIDNYGYGKEGEFSNYNWCMVMRLWYCANTTVRNGISFIGTNYEMSAFMDNQLVMDTISRNNNQIDADFNISTDPSSNPHRLDIFICQKGAISFVPGVGKEYFSLKIFGLNNNICAYPDDDIIKNCVPSKITTTATTNTPPVDVITPSINATESPVAVITPPVDPKISPIDATTAPVTATATATDSATSPVDPNISPVDPKITPIDATTSPVTATATATDSATSPVTATTTDSATSPVTATATDSATSPVTATTTDSATSPVTATATSPITATTSTTGVKPLVYTRQPTYFIDHFKNESDFNLDSSLAGGSGLSGFSSPQLTIDNCYLPKLNMTTPIMNPNSNASQEVWVQSSESYSNRYNKSFGRYLEIPFENRFYKQDTTNGVFYTIQNYASYGINPILDTYEDDENNFNWCFAMKLWYCAPPTGNMQFSYVGFGYEIIVYMDDNLIADFIGHQSNPNLFVDFNITRDSNPHKLDIFMCQKGRVNLNVERRFILTIFGDLENCDHGKDITLENCIPVSTSTSTSPVTATTTTSTSTTGTKQYFYPRTPTYFIGHSKNETDFNLDPNLAGGAGVRGFTVSQLNADNCYLPKLNMTTPIMNPNSNASQEVWVQSSESYSNRYNKSFGKYMEIPFENRFSKRDTTDGPFYQISDTDINPISDAGFGNEDDIQYNWCFVMKLWYCAPPTGIMSIYSSSPTFEMTVFMDDILVTDFIGHQTHPPPEFYSTFSISRQSNPHKLDIFMCQRGRMNPNTDRRFGLKNCTPVSTTTDTTSPVTATDTATSPVTATTTDTATSPVTATTSTTVVKPLVYTRQPTYFIDHFKNESDFNLDPSLAGGNALSGFSSPQLTIDNCYLPKLNMTTPIMNPNSNASQEVWVQSSESYSNRYNKSFGRYLEIPFENKFNKQVTTNGVYYTIQDYASYGINPILDTYEDDENNYNWCFAMKLWYCAPPTGNMQFSYVGFGYEIIVYMDDNLVTDFMGHQSNPNLYIDFNITRDSNPHKLDIFMCQKGRVNLNVERRFILTIFGDLENCDHGKDITLENCIPISTTTTTSTPPVTATATDSSTSPVTATDSATSPVTATATDSATSPVTATATATDSATSPVTATATATDSATSPVTATATATDSATSPVTATATDSATSPVTATATATSTPQSLLLLHHQL